MRFVIKNIFLYVLFTSLVNITMNSQKPNILLIQVDDMGYDDLSINGNPLSNTPNLDALSEQSVRFDNFIVNSVCAPTRASLLTGRDHWRTGVSSMHGGNDHMHMNETTFGNVFQDNGYATGMWGKWHSGKSDGYWPWDRGFDEAYFAQLYKYFPSSGWYNEYPKKTTHKGKWSATALVDYTIDFIERKKEEPFLAYLSFLTCHDMWEAPESYKKKYLDAGRTERYATLLGMLEFMDAEVGRLLKHLTDNDLDENTIVLFMSDNGPNVSKTNKEEWALRNVHGYIGSKSRLWQNGIKSPLYIRWNGKYKPADVERLVTITDIFPTLLDMAGLKLPENNLALNGRSIIPYLNGDTKSLTEREGVMAHWFPYWKDDQFSPIQKEDKASFKFYKQRVTLINERYKLIQNPSKTMGAPKAENKRNLVLLDAKNNKIETENIYRKNTKIANVMLGKMAEWFEDVKNEPHSFASPVFQIGWKGKKASEIIAFGPSRVSGVKNESHKISGFDTVGDYAQYKIYVHEEGTYKISITGRGNLNGITLAAKCNNENIEAALEGKKATIGNIKLSEGAHTLQLEVVRFKSGAKHKTLTYMNLEKQ